MDIELIDVNGTVDLGTDEAVVALRSDPRIKSFFIDANIALDLARSQKTEGRDQSLLRLVEIAARTGTAINADLALEELSTGALLVGDSSRGPRLRNELGAALRAYAAVLQVPRRTLSRSFLSAKELQSYRRVHATQYVHLLKIEQLALASRKKVDAVSNLREYIRWANHDVRNLSGYGMQLAMDIFGGEPRAARLLSVDSKQPQENRAWNAAWDLVQASATHFESAREVGATLTRAILVTRDRSLSYVAHRCVVAAFVRDSPLGDVTLAGSNIDQPFLLPFREEIGVLLREAFAFQQRRIQRADSATPRDMSVWRDRLEKELGLEGKRFRPKH